MDEELLPEVTEQEELTPDVTEKENVKDADSILTSIKELLGLEKDCDDFNTDIIIHINSALMVLTQLGIGPSTGFFITDKYAVWKDFISDLSRIEGIKTYIYLKVKLVFDPPQSAAGIESFNQMIKELEWRLNIAAETKTEEEV